ncbi:hypothetical protein FHT87_003784 [Rhizobium sp. BK316]|uniref:hypothetical protein n=1 Tax=Rhizobium sp. BK316 TaxID=2587053 RepID=UPI001610DE7E|nr:hypothetical protein [Rhizobium sp. BK316]MBB3409865.1 hypothetical protein [Rhizobium sp. BK316]
MRATIAITLIAAALLASCAPTEKQFDAAITVLRGSERARNDLLDDCIRRLSLSDKKTHHNAAVVMNVADKDAPKVACNRYTKALVSGRATYQDLLDLQNRRYTPKLIKIFQGR